MDELNVQKTKTTPKVRYDKAEGVLEISGRSIPENTSKFYEPILNWIDSYKLSANKRTVLKIYLEYFNTGSSKYLFQILKRFEELHAGDTDEQVIVEWFYEDGVEELAEAGEDFRDILNLPFKIMVYEG